MESETTLSSTFALFREAGRRYASEWRCSACRRYGMRIARRFIAGIPSAFPAPSPVGTIERMAQERLIFGRPSGTKEHSRRRTPRVETRGYCLAIPPGCILSTAAPCRSVNGFDDGAGRAGRPRKHRPGRVKRSCCRQKCESRTKTPATDSVGFQGN